MSKAAKLSVVVLLCLMALPLLNSAPQASMATEYIFDDPALERMKAQSNDSTTSNQLIVRVSHDDKGPLTHNFTRVNELLMIETAITSSSESNYSLDHDAVFLKRLESPISAWQSAFLSRNKSMVNASSWGQVLQPINQDGWCGNNALLSEQTAFQATLLMLPKNSNLGVACPEFAGAQPSQPPQANEIIWLIWLDSSEMPVDWLVLNDWCNDLSDNSEFQFEPAGVNMLFKEAERVAKQDLSQILPVTALILFGLLLLFLRDLKSTVVTLGSVILVVAAVMGSLQVLGYQFSVIDGIAIPIIMGVAVDGVFWYKSSRKSKHEVRNILLLAMATTVAAISLALFSPIKAQRGLALVMIFGIVLDWALTRYVLEDFYFNSRRSSGYSPPSFSQMDENKRWLWPSCLTILVVIALTSPTGVEALDIEQFLPEDSDYLEELGDLRDVYIIASGTIVFITLDIDTSDAEDTNKITRFRTQFDQHPSIISYDTGLTKQHLVLGIGETQSSNFSALYENTSQSVIINDPWLRVNGDITGGMIIAIIDGEDSESAYQFLLDTQDLMATNNVSGEIGGQLITGIDLAKSFEQTRIIQILAAGCAVFVIAFGLTRSPEKAIRIAAGTIAVGIAVDGLASHFGGRGVNTAPAVLLGMGFAADYLSHASDKMTSLKSDNFARWGAAATSGLVFVTVSFSKFPPAKSTGTLLSLTILISVILASCLAFTYPNHRLLQEE